MGGLISRAFGRLLDTSEDVKILMLGLDAAGKTTMLYQMKVGEVISTIPTIGFNVESVSYKNLNFTMWDVGGQKKIRILWHHYFSGARGLIFIVDSNDRDRIEEAREELWSILADDALAAAPVLVFANKQDLPRALDTHAVAEKLDMTKMRGRQWHIQGCNAITGEGIDGGMEWLGRAIKDGRRS